MAIPDKPEHSTTTQVVCVSIIVLMIPFSIWWHAFCSAQIWNWYAPSWGWMLVNWHMMVGLFILINIATMSLRKSDNLLDKDSDTVKMLFKIIGMEISFAVFLLVAYIYRP